MKKKSLFIAVLALACACISCNKERELVQEPAEYLLTAGTEGTGADTKTYIATGNWGKEIRWNEKDQISVFSEHSNTYTYTLKEGAKTTSGVFSTSTKPDFKSDSKYAAYFPASVVKDDNGRTFTWPSEQIRVLYSPEIVALPLLAEGNIEDGAPSNATFNCLGGVLDILLKIPANGVPGYVRKVVISAGQKISGEFTLQTATEYVRDSQGNLTSETVEKKYAVIANDGSNTITYTLDGNYGKGMYVSQGEGHHLIISMPVSPAGGYTDFQVDFYDQHGTRISGAKSKDNLVIERGMITNATIPFSHKYAPGLTMNDSVGTIGTLYGVEAIVIEVGGYKRALALHNVGYTNENPAGTEFSVDSDWHSTPALDLKNGWRLPYVEEWKAIADTYGNWQKLDNPRIFPMRIADQTVELPFVSSSSEYICLNHGGGLMYGPDSNGYYCLFYNDAVDYISNNAYVRAIRELPFYPELDPERQLTKDDPVGSIGMIGTRQAVVMKLRGYKVAVATVDVGGSVPEEPGNKFNFSGSGEAYCWDYDQVNLTDGWRLPTSQEITELATGFKIKDDNDNYNVWRWPLSDVATLVIPSIVNYVSGETDYYWGRSSVDTPGTLEQDAQVYAYARPFHNLEEITKDSPEGTVGVVDGRECVVVKGGSDKKVLISVNNPGPCEGGFGTEGRNEPRKFDCYKHGAYQPLDRAKTRCDGGFFGNGWQIASYGAMVAIADRNANYSRTWNSSEKRLEVKITNSYTWYLYAGGYMDGDSYNTYPQDTDKCYYLYKNEEGEYGCVVVGYDNYWPEGYDFQAGSLNVETKKYRYNFCLTHEMPN